MAKVRHTFARLVTAAGSWADREIRKASMYASPTLTVRRLLHVEVDSTGPVVNNHVDGHITGFCGGMAGNMARTAAYITTKPHGHGAIFTLSFPL